MAWTPKLHISTLLDKVICAIESHRRWQLVTTAMLSTLAVFAVFGATSNSRAAQARWGASSLVLITTSDLVSGTTLTSENTASVQAPQQFISRGAVTMLVVGMTTSRQLLASSIITTLDLAGSANTTLPNGWRIVAFPADVIIPELAIGDIVDVVTAGLVVAADARVMTPATHERGVEIAVPADLAATVAAAVNNGDTSLVASG